MSHPAAVPDDSALRLEHLSEAAREVLRLAAARGASQADVILNDDSGLSVNVRLGEVETVERNRDRGVAVTVYFGQRKGNASTADLQPGSLEATVEQACAIARHTEPDACNGLADAARMAHLVDELAGVLRRPRFRRFLTIDESDEASGAASDELTVILRILAALSR